jgi:F0F1-type ATP synthase membrane subunit c/vacuolar-type H+-ATPase subunit K
MSTVLEKTREANRETGRVIGEHPLPSALTAFAVGVGVGVVGVMLLYGRSRQEDAAMTKRVLDAISNALPESIAKHFS